MVGLAIGDAKSVRTRMRAAQNYESTFVELRGRVTSNAPSYERTLLRVGISRDNTYMVSQNTNFSYFEFFNNTLITEFIL